MRVPSRPDPGPRFSWGELFFELRAAKELGRLRKPLSSMNEIRERIASRRSSRWLANADDQFLTLGQAAFVLVRSRGFVRRLIRDGVILGRLVSVEESPTGIARWLIPVAEIRAIAERDDE